MVILLPQYYREGYFSKDSLLHPELPGGRYGIAGDPVPYRMGSDSIVTSLLLLCFILAVIAFSNVQYFFKRQAKYFFLPAREGLSEVKETSAELRLQLFLASMAALLLALFCYFYTTSVIGSTLVFDSQHLLIGIYIAVFCAYFVVKFLLYAGVNRVFFDGKRNEQWGRALVFITMVESILLFPALLVLAYFNAALVKVEIYLAIVLIFVKIMAFYKCYSIFFKQSVVRLQIILYFCALEIVPLFILWGILDLTAHSLIVNY